MERKWSSLTPAHHLRGAAQNKDLSAILDHMLVRSTALAAPRRVHALVRPQRTTLVSVRKPTPHGMGYSPSKPADKSNNGAPQSVEARNTTTRAKSGANAYAVRPSSSPR